MNFINRAIKNITRRKSRSIIMALTFFLIGNLVIIGLGINQAAESAKVITRKSMQPIVKYEADYEQYWIDADKLETDEERTEFYETYNPTVKMEDVNAFLESPYLSAINAVYFTEGKTLDFEAVPLNNEYEKNQNEEDFEIRNEMFESYDMVYVESDVALRANAYPNMIEFENGQYTMIDGNFYTQDDIDNANKVVVIEKRLAEHNNLRIGDTITIDTDPNLFTWGNENPYLTEDIAVIELEIIGIYETAENVDPTADNFDWMRKMESPYNQLLIPSSTIYDLQWERYQANIRYEMEMYPENEYEQMEREDFFYLNSVTMLLNDPLVTDDFIAENQDLLRDYMMFDANDEEFKKMSKPLDTLSLFSNIIVWIVVINAVVIITLITALTLKSREYEIGVLLSMGVSKGKVVGQLFLELLAVAILGFTLAVASGSLISSSVGNAVLEYQVSQEEVVEDGPDYSWYGDPNYFTEISQEELLANYDVTVGPILIAQIYVLGVAVVFISILIPAVMVMRFNPKRILTNAN